MIKSKQQQHRLSGTKCGNAEAARSACLCLGESGGSHVAPSDVYFWNKFLFGIFIFHFLFIMVVFICAWKSV